MNKFPLVFLLLAIATILGCNENKKSEAYYESGKQFSKLIKDLNNQFTEKAAYSSIMLSYDKLMGNSILVKVSPDIDSIILEEWFYMSGKWDKKSEMALEFNNQKPSDFLFTINGDFDLLKLVDIVELAKEKVISEKKVKAIECKSVSILMKNLQSTANKMDHLIIQITIETIDSGSSYDLGFDSNGNFEGFLN
jgi:hypothetical protein